MLLKLIPSSVFVPITIDCCSCMWDNSKGLLDPCSGFMPGCHWCGYQNTSHTPASAWKLHLFSLPNIVISEKAVELCIIMLLCSSLQDICCTTAGVVQCLHSFYLLSLVNAEILCLICLHLPMPWTSVREEYQDTARIKFIYSF